MKIKTLILTTMVAASAVTPSFAASIIAINLMRDAARTPAANDGSEYGITSWVDVLAGDQALATDGVNVTWTSGGAWSGGGNGVENGYNDNAGSYTVTGLSAWLAANSATGYTVQLVQASDTADNWFGDSELRDTDGAGALLDTLTNANLQRGSTSVSNELSADVLLIDPTTAGTAPVGGGGARTNTAGIIIRAVPEPSSTGLLALGGLALILHRRK